MTKTELQERIRQDAALIKLGFSQTEAEQLRRIARTLRRWFEYECGTGDGRVTLSIERDGEDGDGKPFLRRQWMGAGNQWQDIRTPIPDREAGARRRLAAIMAKHPRRWAFVQGDCRGPSLYIGRKSDVTTKELATCYTLGVAID